MRLVRIFKNEIREFLGNREHKSVELLILKSSIKPFHRSVSILYFLNHNQHIETPCSDMYLDLYLVLIFELKIKIMWIFIG